MKKKRERMKGGRQSAVIPPVRSMTDLATPAATSGAAESEKPADEPSEELTRTIKSAYQ